MIEIAEKKGKYKEIKIGNFAESLPYPSNTFDLILSNGLLGYIANAKPIFELVRTLKAGGYILLNMRTHIFTTVGTTQFSTGASLSNVRSSSWRNLTPTRITWNLNWSISFHSFRNWNRHKTYITLVH